MKKILLILCFSLTNIIFSACPDVLDHDLRVLASKEVKNLCEYENKVILAVNVASRCGYTYQYDALQSLYEEYKGEGFIVLGFPSNDFFQEFTEEEKVKEYCRTNYKVNFPMFRRSHVTNGGKLGMRSYVANPFFQRLISASGQQPEWNFNKYLISRNGEVKHFNQSVEPDSKELVDSIKKLL